MTRPAPITHPDIDQLDRSLKRLDALAVEPHDAGQDNPLFLASIGWRAGAGLMQRVLMTDPRLLMWGEPIERAQFVSRITDALSSVLDHWPPTEQLISHRPNTDRKRDWAASLAPDTAHLKSGLRSLFDNWLARPARDRGFQRWGVKETRWSGQDGQVLRWLYPNSQFVVIARHPVASFQSLLQFNLRQGWGVWERWPDRFIDDLESYATLWNTLATSWADVAERLEAPIIRFEDLTQGGVDLAALGQRLGLALQPRIALADIAEPRSRARPMSAADRDLLNGLTAPGRAALGYDD